MKGARALAAFGHGNDLGLGGTPILGNLPILRDFQDPKMEGLYHIKPYPIFWGYSLT